MHLNNCEFNCSSQIRNPPIFICWFLLFVSHCTNFSCISNLLDSRCLHSLFIYMLFWNFRCINLNIIKVGNMVISNPQIRSSSLGLHRLSLSFWFPVDTRHRLGLHRVAFPSKQVIKGDRWVGQASHRRRAKNNGRRARWGHGGPDQFFLFPTRCRRLTVWCFAHLLWYLASFSLTPSIPNYKSFQKC